MRADMDSIDAVVIGAGVVGLAVARALAQSGREVIVLEAEDAIGTHTSSRNSEVIHAGIYYPKDSLKARACVEGRHRLYDYCASHGVPCRRCGKLIVATQDAQLAELESIRERALANGVDDIVRLDRAQTLALEPALAAVASLHSPSTGIIDSHALMLAYLGDAEDAGAAIAFNAPLIGGEVGDNGLTLNVGGAEPMSIACDILVNSGGLHAEKVARSIAGVPGDTVPVMYYAKGNYFVLAGRAPFNRLIYPVPVKAGLGVHLTLDLAGQARFGPDVEWIDELDYTVDPSRGDQFYGAVRKYWPGLPDNSLQPAYSGIRPKIQAPGEPARDFTILGPDDHGVKGLVNLFGIESPGLTASLAIAKEVAAKLG